ncbi:hypothetical protein OE88DRAFT_1798707 [Heliocybe sulcata]|uniref:BTB domain-containing protein n=1 Tax=Heliocybe sulcata TaxID=5364 RepID=A0A5C3N3X5_9AGAM|nr:hypothetical protein OE88DRAFT_1798707 [Heliocybe sulcata]
MSQSKLTRKRTGEDDESAPSPVKKVKVLDEDDAPPAYSTALATAKGLWYEDGTVILNCAGEAFRVHQGFLSTHSVVLKARFANLHPSESLKLEHVPVLNIEEAARDMAELLSILYFRRNTFDNTHAVTLRSLSSLLHVASVYEVAPVRKDIIQHMIKLYPLSYTEFVAMPPGLRPRRDEAILAVDVARRFNLHYILPIALYYCCELPTTTLLKGYTAKGVAVNLSPEDLELCLIARDDLRIFQCTIVDRFAGGMQPSKHCEGGACRCRSSLVDVVRAQRCHHSSAIFTALPKSAIYGTGIVCEPCRTEWREMERKGVKQVWESLPGLFGLPSWGELQRNMNIDLASGS